MAKTVSFLSVIFQLLLLSKAVYVAIKGSDHVFPTSKKSGLAYIYASLVTALLTSFIQSATAQAMITRWKRQAALLAPCSSTGSEDDITSPLLSDEGSPGKEQKSTATAAAAAENNEEGEAAPKRSLRKRGAAAIAEPEETTDQVKIPKLDESVTEKAPKPPVEVQPEATPVEPEPVETPSRDPLAGGRPREDDNGGAMPLGGGADVPVPILHDHDEVEHWGVDARGRPYRVDEFGHKLTTTGTTRPPG